MLISQHLPRACNGWEAEAKVAVVAVVVAEEVEVPTVRRTVVPPRATPRSGEPIVALRWQLPLLLIQTAVLNPHHLRQLLPPRLVSHVAQLVGSSAIVLLTVTSSQSASTQCAKHES